MNTSYKYTILFVYLLLTGILFSLPFSLYDQDGYLLWAPVLSEYLRGSNNYTFSDVIFNGQNLASIYGELPFWKLFRFLKFSFIEVLNVTHSIFLIMFTTLGFIIVSGHKEKKMSNFFLVFLLACLSPVIVNRLYAGHLNLLFGVLPFFIFASLVYCKNFWHLAFCVFSLACSMSTQAFQMLSYHIFYLPLLILIIKREEKDHGKYFKTSLIVFVLAFIVSFSSMGQMVKHALSNENLRGLNVNMVYTYLITEPMDLFQFIVSDIYPFLMRRSLGFYHEISYPLGMLLIIFCLCPIDRKIKYCVGFMFAFFVFFSMNVPWVNLISEIPTIRPFRVPQRVFMILNLFIPLWVLAKIDLKITKKEGYLFFFFILSSQVFIFMDLVMATISALFLFNKRDRNINYAVIFGLIGLCAGSISKMSKVLITDKQFKITSEYIQKIRGAYSSKELEGRKFHFQTFHPMMVNAVAQSYGLATLEGYGHPPKSLLVKFKDIFAIEFPPYTNNLYIAPTLGDDKKFKKLGINSVVNFSKEGVVNISDLK